MSIKVVVAEAHRGQLENEKIKKEFDSISEAINSVELNYVENTINFVYIKGIYKHSERKMVTACLFVNKMDESICGLHGDIRLKFKSQNAEIAKTTIDFDKEFMGILNPNEALLVHFSIPVKGLEDDREFTIKDVEGVFLEVRVKK